MIDLEDMDIRSLTDFKRNTARLSEEDEEEQEPGSAYRELEGSACRAGREGLSRDARPG